MDQATNDKIIAGIQTELERTAPPEGFPALPTIPAGRYIDPEFLELENKYVWKKSWLYALHKDELPEVGSYRLWDRTGSPIIILRSGEDEFRAHYNTCSHRGAPLVQQKSGKRGKLLVCPYHGWSFDFDGNLKAVRDPRDFPDFDSDCYRLRSVRCEAFGNWLFVNEDMDAPPLLQAIAPFPDHWENLGLEDIAHMSSISLEIKCNVQVMLDAFMETYHLASIHQKTVNRFLDHIGTHIQLFKGGNMLMVTPQRDLEWQDPGARGMPTIPTATEVQRIYNPSYHFFPNLVAPVSDSGIPFLTFWPKDQRTMIVDSHWFGPREAKGHPGWENRLQNWANIMEEDTQFAPDIQKSIEAGGFQGVNPSYQERRIYFWHEEVDRRIGAENIPEALRIKPLMEKHLSK